MSYKSTYTPGLWKAVCDQCGREFKSNELRLRWDNLMVCSDDYEPRQPQDFVRAIPDIQAPPWTRPEGQDIFVPFCTIAGMSAIVEYAMVDCAIVDYVSPLFNPIDWPLPCIPITISSPTTLGGAETRWACGQAAIEADLTLLGTLGVYS
jgi:hypothetical protein